VRKINVDTDNRLAMTGAIRKVFAETPEKFDPRDYNKPAREAMQKVVALRMTQFGQAGHAGDYQPALPRRNREAVQVVAVAWRILSVGTAAPHARRL